LRCRRHSRRYRLTATRRAARAGPVLHDRRGGRSRHGHILVLSPWYAAPSRPTTRPATQPMISTFVRAFTARAYRGRPRRWQSSLVRRVTQVLAGRCRSHRRGRRASPVTVPAVGRGGGYTGGASRERVTPALPGIRAHTLIGLALIRRRGSVIRTGVDGGTSTHRCKREHHDYMAHWYIPSMSITPDLDGRSKSPDRCLSHEAGSTGEPASVEASRVAR